MKKWLLTALGILLLLPAQAQTNITSPIVSGTWTAAGSPYIIKTDIVIPPNNYLRIEPGVNIRFDGYYQIFVKGHLQVKGKPDSRVCFYAKDTLGWYNSSNRTGGWRGIKMYAGSSVDSSYFRYCDIRDMKDAPGVWGDTSSYKPCGIYTERKLRFSNCRFLHSSGNDAVVSISSEDPAVTLAIDSCTFTDNQERLVTIDNSGISYIRNCNFYHNNMPRNNTGTPGISLLTAGSDCRLSIEDNEVYENGGGFIIMYANEVKIRRNKIHHNKTETFSIIEGGGLNIEIDDNYIYNNHFYLTAGCFPMGGSVMRLGAFTDNLPMYERYKIRNNVIANNLADFMGGAMEFRLNARALIANNTIVSNYANTNGAAISIPKLNTYDSNDLVIKNNLFYTNASGDNKLIANYTKTKMIFDHNYISGPVNAQFGGDVAVTFLGDTTHNVIGTQPGMVSPTVMTGLYANAGTADFSLKNNSVCINKGDTVLARHLGRDIAGNTRIVGTKIDIGAYESLTGNPTGIGKPAGKEITLHVYPNPATHDLTVDLPIASGQIRIIDGQGRQLIQKEVSGKHNRINLSSLASGIYYLHWQDGTQQGRVSFTKLP